MIKKLLVAGIVLLTVSAVGLYLVFMNLPKLVKVEIEQQGSKALGVSVRVASRREGPTSVRVPSANLVNELLLSMSRKSDCMALGFGFFRAVEYQNPHCRRIA